jgi:uncharacterized repeat protein (TIGR01451 family)
MLATLVVDSPWDDVDAAPTDGMCRTASDVCTLRAAVQTANALSGSDTIVLSAGTYSLSLPGANENAAATGDLDVTDMSGETVIQGVGQGATILDGAQLDRVFDVLDGADLRLEHLTVTGGRIGTNERGGGIRSAGHLTVRNSTIRHNEAPGLLQGGGGISVSGVTEIRDSTISHNEAGGQGGGILNRNLLEVIGSTIHDNVSGRLGGGIETVFFGGGQTVTIANSTISGNIADEGAGGINVEAGSQSGNVFRILNSTVTQNQTTGQGGYGDAGGILCGGAGVLCNANVSLELQNAIVAGNQAAGSSPDVLGPFTSLGFNLVGDPSGSTGFGAVGDQLSVPAGLLPLADNGGPTWTHALAPGSQALDAGVDATGAGVDQRGVPRPFDSLVVNAPGSDGSDIGAFELVTDCDPYALGLADYHGPDRTGSDGPLAEIGLDLAVLRRELQCQAIQPGGPFQPSNPLLEVAGELVAIDAVSEDPLRLEQDLASLGFEVISRYERVVTGWIAIESLDQVAALSSLVFAVPVYRPWHNAAPKYGDDAMFPGFSDADVARGFFGVDGAGSTVGVLSNSFNSLNGYAADQLSCDLPGPLSSCRKQTVKVIAAGLGNDEGRAMLQLVHDVAPGADLAFATGQFGQGNFADNIRKLAAQADADILVDDLQYPNEPMFQDGIVAQAVDEVVDQGVAYFSAVGNLDRQSYESAFNPVTPNTGLFTGKELHDFGAGSFSQRIDVVPSTPVALSFQWDEPFFSLGGPALTYDLDFYVSTSPTPTSSSDIIAQGSSGQDPYEIVSVTPATSPIYVIIEKTSGPPSGPGLMKYVAFGPTDNITIDPVTATHSPTAYGHSNARGAEAVGAAFYQNTPRFGTVPPVVEDFSSVGGVQILFDANCNRLPNPESRQTPDVVGPDGTNTSFFGLDINDPETPGVGTDLFPNFFGTSAAAPHVAGVAALMLQATGGAGSLTPRQIYAVLEDTAVDMDDPFTTGFDIGVDAKTGYGLVNAEAALGNLPGALGSPSAIPGVTLDVPDTALINETFTFTTTFDNLSPSQIGFGPFVDLSLQYRGTDGVLTGTHPNVSWQTSPVGYPDGLGFNTADAPKFFQPNVRVYYKDKSHEITGSQLHFTWIDNNAQGTQHPFAQDSSGNLRRVQGAAGDLLVSVQLPFGSFAPNQPPAPLIVEVHLSEWADLGNPLYVRARGGFQYGVDPQDNPTVDPPVVIEPDDSSRWTEQLVTPAVVQVSKSNNAPENETATGPNFPRQWTVVVDVANNQTVTSLVLTDYLPNNVTYLGYTSTPPESGFSPPVPGSTPLVLKYASIAAFPTDQTPEIVVTIDFYVPDYDANGDPIVDLVTGEPSLTPNDVKAVGDWKPVDTRDFDFGDPSTYRDNAVFCQCGPEDVLINRSIAIQKGYTIVVDQAPLGIISPSDIVQYALDFQVSDYFGFENIVIDDYFTDGQVLDTSFTPRLMIETRSTVHPSAPFASANYDAAAPLTAGSHCPVNQETPFEYHIQFDVSNELAARGIGTGGQLLGGLFPGPPNQGRSIGRILFQTQVLEAYGLFNASGEPHLNEHDELSNCVAIEGDVLDPNQLRNDGTHQATGYRPGDGSQAKLQVAPGQFEKSIYAFNGATIFPTPLLLAPGDEVTFKLKYTPTLGDFEKLRFVDFLPAPLFDANEGLGLWPANPLLPGGTWTQISGPTTPTVTVRPLDNAIEWNFGTFPDPLNAGVPIEILFTVTATSIPYADGPFMTNQGVSSHQDTHLHPVGDDEIVQVVASHPSLQIRKGIVATDNPNAVFTDSSGTPSPLKIPSGVTFNGPGAPGFSAGLGWPIDSLADLIDPEMLNNNLQGIDAGDLVTFVVVVENLGSSRFGAFDVQVRDQIPSGFQAPNGGFNLSVADGTGAPIPWINVNPSDTSPIFQNGIELVDPGPTPEVPGTREDGGALDRGKDDSLALVATGRNVAVITYDLVVSDSGVLPCEELTNTAELLHYAALPMLELYNTGVDDDRVVLPNGTPDPHYDIFRQPSNGTLVDRKVPAGFPFPAWIANDSDSAWIGPNVFETRGPGGDYTYRTSFDVPLVTIPTDARISGSWTADNTGSNIDLNTFATGNTTPISTYYQLTPFRVDTPFVSGANDLDFRVNNIAGATGLRVDNIDEFGFAPDYVSAGHVQDRDDRATAKIACPVSIKTLVATSEPHTADPDVAIGEIVRYRLQVEIPEGGFSDVKLVDHLPAGFELHTSLLTEVRYDLVSDDLMTASVLNYTVAVPVVPPPNALTLLFPDTRITPGGTPIFDFGSIQNHDNDSNPEYLILEFNALVQNVVLNADGQPKDNTFDVEIDQVLFGPSNAVRVTIVEPSLKVEKKAVRRSGDTVTYQVTVENVGSTSAFDVSVLDVLPSPQLTLLPGILTTAVDADNSWGNRVDLLKNKLPAGGKMLIVYTATVNSCGTIDNRVTVDYSSLPGDYGTTPNPTGSSTPGNPGDPDGERVYTSSASVSLGSIGDLVWHDVNGDGSPAGEPGLPGATVILHSDGPDNKLGGGDDIDLTTTTDANGNYCFGGLPEEEYEIRVDPGTVAKGMAPTTPQPITVNLGPGAVYADADFGYAVPGSICGYKFEDLNGNGVLDLGERPWGGVTIHLNGFDGMGKSVPGTAVTNMNGEYCFSDLMPGTYWITETPPPGSVQKTPNPLPITVRSGQRYAAGPGPVQQFAYEATLNSDELVVTAGADHLITIGPVGSDIRVNGKTFPGAAPTVTSIVVWGGSGDNIIDLSAVTSASFSALRTVTISGGDGNDTIRGSQFDDKILAGGGNDFVDGGPGDDAINGGAGNDTLVGDDGNDDLCGGDGNDILIGGLGNDMLCGNQGDDRLEGGDGDDYLNGGDGDDVLDGGNGDDGLAGNDGSDSMNGGPGQDTLLGGPGDDVLNGGDGDDLALGEGGVDNVDGGPGIDTVAGGGNGFPFTNDARIGETIDENASAIVFWAACPEIQEIINLVVVGGGIVSELAFGNCPSCHPIPPPGPAVGGDWSWIPLDERRGTKTAEEIHHNLTGTHMGNPTPVAGRVDGALRFDGVDDYVNFPHNSALDIATEDFSMDLWVMTDDHSGIDVLVDKRREQFVGGVLDVQGYSLFLNDGYVGFQLADGSGYRNYIAPASVTDAFVADGNWHFVAVTVDRDDPSGGRLYVDGRHVWTFDPSTRPNSLANTFPFRLGSRSSSVSGLFRGVIDEFELFHYELGPTDVEGIYNARSAGKCKPPMFQAPDPPLVKLSLVVFNQAGEPVSAVLAGSEVLLQGYVEDVRPEPQGIYAAYADVFYDPSFVSIAGPLSHNPEMPEGLSGDAATPGQIDEVGSFAGLSTPPVGRTLLFSIPIRVHTGIGTGEEIYPDEYGRVKVTFVLDAADNSPQHDVLLTLEEAPVPPELIDFGTATLDIYSWHNAANPTDVDGNGFTSAIDVLLIINELNSHTVIDAQGQIILSDDPRFSPPPFLDVNGDGIVTPGDVLQVINKINALAAQGEGEPLSMMPIVEADYIEPAQPVSAITAVAVKPSQVRFEEGYSEANRPIFAKRGRASDDVAPVVSPDPFDEPWELLGLESVLEELVPDVTRAW